MRTRQWSAAVDGVETDFLVSGYADWIMLVATQTGTLGTMMQARWAVWRSPGRSSARDHHLRCCLYQLPQLLNLYAVPWASA